MIAQMFHASHVLHTDTIVNNVCTNQYLSLGHLLSPVELFLYTDFKLVSQSIMSEDARMAVQSVTKYNCMETTALNQWITFLD